MSGAEVVKTLPRFCYCGGRVDRRLVSQSCCKAVDTRLLSLVRLRVFLGSQLPLWTGGLRSCRLAGVGGGVTGVVGRFFAVCRCFLIA